MARPAAEGFAVELLALVERDRRSLVHSAIGFATARLGYLSEVTANSLRSQAHDAFDEAVAELLVSHVTGERDFDSAVRAVHWLIKRAGGVLIDRLRRQGIELLPGIEDDLISTDAPEGRRCAGPVADALQLFLDGWSCLRVSHWLAREHEIDASPERVAVVIANALAFGVVHGRGRADKQHLRALRARLRPRLRPGLARYFVQHGLDGVDLEIVVDMALCVPDTRTAKRLVLTVECVRGRRHRLRRVNDAVAQACPIRPDEPGF